jgi:hypothetical protein
MLALACWMRKRTYSGEAHSKLGVLVASRFLRLRIRSSPTFQKSLFRTLLLLSAVLF